MEGLEIEVVNVVASGSLGLELDLTKISEDLKDIVEYDPSKYPGAYFRFEESTPLITLYRNGKYIISGASSEEGVYSTRDRFLASLYGHAIIPSAKDESFRLQNLVCVSDVGENLELSTLAIELGLEDTEYEPEQFPGLVYRPQEHRCVLLVFGSGKVIITGATSIPAVEEAFTSFQERIVHNP
jgi:transcription initiation factor TFIID TATA-box-binding protein